VFRDNCHRFAVMGDEPDNGSLFPLALPLSGGTFLLQLDWGQAGTG
jgi:hypothetical protein